MRYPKKRNVSGNEYRRIFLESLGKYFQIILVELGRKNLNNYEVAHSNNPFTLPSDSHWTTLGEVIEFSSNLDIQKLSPDTKINYVDIDSIDNEEYQIREIKLRTVSELSSRARRVLKKGYMVYSLVRPYLNNLALITVDKENFIGSTGFAVFKGTRLTNEYLKLILLSDYVRQRFLEMLSGFNSPTVTKEQFIQTPVPSVPKNLQAAIVCFLSDLERDKIKEDFIYFDKEVESKIVNLHKSQMVGNKLLNEISTQEQTLQLLRQTILQEAVQGKLTTQNPKDEPATELLKRIKSEKQKLIKAGKLRKEKELPPITEDEIPFELPDGWVWCRLGEVGKINPRNLFDDDKKVSFVPMTLISSEFGKAPQQETRNWKEVKSSFTHFAENDVAVAKITPCFENSKAAIFKGLINGIGAGTTELHVFRGNVKVILPDYVYLFFKSPNFLKNGESKMTGSAGQKRVPSDYIKSCLFPFPPFAEQQRIVIKVQELQQQLNQLEAQVQQSRQYAQQLLLSVLKEAFEEKGKVYEMGEERAWMVAEE